MTHPAEGEDGGTTVDVEYPTSTVDARVPVLTLLHHPDLERVGQRCVLTGLLRGSAIHVTRIAPNFGEPGAEEGAGEPLSDPGISRKRGLWVRAEGAGTRRYALGVDAGAKIVRVEGAQLTPEGRQLTPEELRRGVVIELANRVALLLHDRPRVEPHDEVKAIGRPALIGESTAMDALRERIGRVAPLAIPALLTGQTGAGKELVARAIHAASDRGGGPFVAINMSLLNPGSAQSELFGHVRGAFTGAGADRKGLIASAEGGTIFFDEIADTPIEVQPMLLRFLDYSVIQPMGSDAQRKVDARVVAATDADLGQAVDEGSFRAQILHRLGQCVVEVPRLSERRDDIARLFVHFLRAALASVGADHQLKPADPAGLPWLPASLMARVVRQPWSGNVRELRNAAWSLAIAHGSEPHVPLDAPLGQPEAAGSEEGAPAESHESEASAARRIEDISEDELVEAMRACRFEPGRAAKRLGVARSSIYKLIDGCDRIRKASELTQAEIEASLKAQGGDLKGSAMALEVSLRGLKLQMNKLGMS